jgi:hypothetical protein
MIAAVAGVLTACGGANDGDPTTDTTSMPAEPMTVDSVGSAGSQPYDTSGDTIPGGPTHSPGTNRDSIQQ